MPRDQERFNVKRQRNPIPTLLTAAEAAAVAGVSLRTLRGWLDSERLPCVRLDAEGVRVAIDGDTLLRFVRQERQPGRKDPAGS